MNGYSRRMGAAGALLSLLLAALPAAAADNLHNLQRQWWQWFINIPIDFHPQVDETGAACVIVRRKDRALFSFASGQYSVLASPVGVYRANAARGLWAVVDTATLALGAHVLRVTTPFQTVRYNLKVARAKN